MDALPSDAIFQTQQFIFLQVARQQIDGKVQTLRLQVT